MRWIAIVLAVLVGLVVLAGGALQLGMESGEVVVLHAQDDTGATQETRLWVVDIDGAAYLRTGNPQTAWLLRVRAHPDVEVTRGDTTGKFRAVPVDDPALRDRVNAAVAEKYALTETAMRALFLVPERATPVRLDPR